MKKFFIYNFIVVSLVILGAFGSTKIIPYSTHYAAAQNTTTVQGFSTGIDDACTGKDCYSLFSGFADALGGKFDNIQNADSIGGLVNAIIAFGIGLGGVLAVAMIMYQGFLYMKTDNTNTKLNTKGKIINTIVGFLLLLTIYTILRTINPDLLNLMPRIDYSQLDPGESGDGRPQDAVTDTDTAGTPPPPTTVSGCKAGIVTVQNIKICKNLAKGLDDMINAAKQAGFTLTGYGWRSSQSQINLRIKNCGGNNNYNIYQKPSGQCNPETAIPGRSRHEQGLAVDFLCAGVQINRSASPSTTGCFNWLYNNANKYGFYNLKSSTRTEDWHWSSDGR
jgi:hypothetical protein